MHAAPPLDGTCVCVRPARCFIWCIATGLAIDCRDGVQASSLAREAQTSGFAVRMPPWISRLCIPHWHVALTLLSGLSPAHTPADGEPLADLTAALRRILDIFSEYFRAAGPASADDAAFGDDAADAVLSYAINTGGGGGSAAAAAVAPPCCGSPLSTVQTMLPPAALLSRSVPVLPTSSFEDPEVDNPEAAEPVDAGRLDALPEATLFVSLDEFPAADSSAFESAAFDHIMSDVVDVGPQEGFAAESLPECYRCPLDAGLLPQPSDTVSLAGSGALSEPPLPSDLVPGAASASLPYTRPPALALPSPTGFTPPASQLLTPSQVPSLAECPPKPSLESFGLEPDEVTAISLGPTPIPSLLAFCRGPSRHATPAADACMRVESAMDESSFHDDSSGPHPPSPHPGADAGGRDGSGASAAGAGSPAGPSVRSPFGGTMLQVASSAGDSFGGRSPVSDAPPASPSPPPQCRSPEPPSMGSPAADVGIPFSTLFAPQRARTPPQPGATADTPCGSCCNIFGSGGTARLVPQDPPPQPAEPFCSATAARCGQWGLGQPNVVTAHSTWHTPEYERGSVMLCGEGSGPVSDDAASVGDGGPCCSVNLVCSHVQGEGATCGDVRADRHRRTASMPAEALAMASRHLGTVPVDGRHGGPGAGEGFGAPSVRGGLFGVPEETAEPLGLMPRPERTADGPGLWGHDGPSVMASRRARSICLDNLNL